jgi:hypothetical protein
MGSKSKKSHTPVACASDRPEGDAQTRLPVGKLPIYFVRWRLQLICLALPQVQRGQTNVLQMRWPNGPLSRAEKGGERNRKNVNRDAESENLSTEKLLHLSRRDVKTK